MISIITPCFNLKDYITATYESIRTQTITEWEWIIIDDASTDNTLSVIESFHDSRIKLIRSGHTGNLAVLRNKGARIAQGKYLAFVDGDDLCESKKIELQSAQLDQFPDIGWNHTNVQILKEETGRLESRKEPQTKAAIVDAEDAFSMLAYRNFVCVSSVMVRKEGFDSVGGFDERFHRCEDINLWLRLTANGYAMGYLSEPLLKYRIRSSGLYTSKTLEYLKMNFVVYDDIQRKFPALTSRHQDSINRHLSDVHLKIAIRLLCQKSGGYIMYFKESFMKAPSLKKLMWLSSSILVPQIIRRYLKNRL